MLLLIITWVAAEVMRRHTFKEEEKSREPLSLKKYLHSMEELEGKGRRKKRICRRQEWM